MRVDIAMRPAARILFLHAPKTRSLWIHQPTLGVAGVVVANLAKRPLFNHFLRLSDGRYAAVVVADHVSDLGLGDSLQHLAALFNIHRQRFFAENVFARLGRSNRDLGMGIIRRIDIDDIDLGIGNNIAPVRGSMIPSVLLAGLLDSGSVPATDRVQPNIVLHIEKTRCLTPAIAVRLAHE